MIPTTAKLCLQVVQDFSHPFQPSSLPHKKSRPKKTQASHHGFLIKESWRPAPNWFPSSAVQHLGTHVHILLPMPYENCNATLPRFSSRGKLREAGTTNVYSLRRKVQTRMGSTADSEHTRHYRRGRASNGHQDRPSRAGACNRTSTLNMMRKHDCERFSL